MFELFLLLLRPFSVFSGFDFTNWQDFLPLVSLAVGVCGAAMLVRARDKRATSGLVALMLFLSLWPLLPNLGLLFLAREVQHLAGSWPQVMVDDPKNWYGHASPFYDGLFHVIVYLEAFSGAWMIAFVAIFFAAKPKFTVVWRRVFVGLTLSSLLVFLIDPGNLFAWWLD